MNLNLLKTFVTIVEEGNYSKAAQKLHLSQPAVSMQMQTLSSELGLNLFLKVGKKVQLTDGGNLLYQEGLSILEKWNDTLLRLDKYKNDISGKLKIGASTIPGLYFLPKTIKKFKEIHPKAELTMMIDDSQNVLEELLEGNIDIAFVGKRINKSGISCCKWVKDRLVLIKGKDFSIDLPVRVKDTAKYPLVMRKEGSGTRALIQDKLKERGIKGDNLNIALELDSTESVMAAVEAGIGISFVSELAAKRGVTLGTLEIIDIDIDFDRELYFAFRSDFIKSNLCQNFIMFLEQRG